MAVTDDDAQMSTERRSSKGELDEQRAECSKTRAVITGLLQEFDSAENKVEAVTKSREVDVNNFARVVNNDVEQLQTTAVDTLNEVIGSFNTLKKWLDGVYRNALKGGFILIAIIAAAYYVYHLYENAWLIDSTELSALLVIPIIGLFYTVMRSFRSKIDERFCVQSIESAKSKTKDFLKTRLNLNPAIFEPVIDSIRSAKNISKKTLDSFRMYIPYLDKYYDSLERIDKQELFKRTLRNALVNYGWDIKDNIMEYFQAFAPLTNTVPEWLTQASIELSRNLGIPPVFVALMYSDYVGDLETTRNAWNSIKTHDVLNDFVKVLIQNRLVATEYLDTGSRQFGSIETLMKKQEKFSLETFRSDYHQFYFDLVNEKLSIIDALRSYGFEISKPTEDKILKFVPRNLEIDKRQEELVTCASSELGKPEEIILLAFYEQEFESTKRTKVWKKLCDDRANTKAVRTEFIELLVEKELVSTPTKYRNDKQILIEYIDKKLASLEDFTLAKASFMLNEEFDSLEEKKKYILRALSYSNLSIKNEAIREDFQNLLEQNDDEKALCEWLSPRLGIPKDILMLFYYDYLQDDAAKDVFDAVKESGQSKVLAKILLERQIVLKQDRREVDGSEIENLALVLEKTQEFDRRSIQILFDKCNRLLDYERDFANFSLEEKMIQNAETDFGPIFDILKSKMKENTLPLLTTLAIDCLEENAVNIIDKEWLSPIAVASLAILLEQRGDDLQFEACRKAAADIRAAKILYQKIFVKESDERDAKPATPLMEIVESVINNQNQKYEFLVPFRNKLSQGSLYPKIGLLVDSILKDLHSTVKEKQEKLAGMFRKITAQIRIFLGGQLNYDVALRSLRMNLVSAYMITSPRARVSVMGEIIGNYLPKVCEEHAKTDRDYKDFLLISDDITGGKGTRLGIVPRGMSFDRFNDQFDKLFRESVDRYIQSLGNAGVVPEDFAANLVRIVPSEAFFKRVIGGEGKEDIESPDHPVNTIRRLIIDRYPALQSFALVASLKGGDEKPTIAMKRLIVDLLDTRSRIFLFVEEEIRSIIGETKIFGKMESGEFDNVLIKELNSSSLSDLCVTAYKAGSKGSQDFETLIRKIRDVIGKLREKGETTIDEDKMNILVENILVVLQSWGGVIEGFSEEASIGQTI